MAYIMISDLPYKRDFSVEIQADESFPVHYLTVSNRDDKICLHLTMEQIEQLGHACLDYVRDDNAAEMIKTVERVGAGPREAA